MDLRADLCLHFLQAVPETQFPWLFLMPFLYRRSWNQILDLLRLIQISRRGQTLWEMILHRPVSMSAPCDSWKHFEQETLSHIKIEEELFILMFGNE